MEFGSPIKQNTITYTVPIQTTRYLTIQYPSTISGSNTTPPLDRVEVKQYISAMAALYEPYSLKWFNKQIPPFFFLQNISHTWDHSNKAPYTSAPKFVGATITVNQTWRPEVIQVQPKLFQIKWILENSEYNSYSVANQSPGPKMESEEIPYGENQIQIVLNETPRSVFHAKIRRAKLIASIANLRVKKLYLKYYKRYGEFTINKKDSPLSSDSEI